jgi:hypothetical protein
MGNSEARDILMHEKKTLSWKSRVRLPLMPESWEKNEEVESPMAATGRQLKQSVNVFHSLMLYLRLPAYEGKKSDRSLFYGAVGGAE